MLMINVALTLRINIKLSQTRDAMTTWVVVHATLSMVNVLKILQKYIAN